MLKLLRLSVCAGLALTMSFAVNTVHAQNYVQNLPPQTLAQTAHRIFDFTNQDREAHGLAPLRWSTSLAASAQAHAERMVSEGYLSHQYPGEPGLIERASHAGAHFQSVAENIATGYSAQGLNDEWMHSEPHRRNILDPHMNSLGVGLVEHNGTLYAVEDFDDGATALSERGVERQVDALLRAQGVNPSVSRSAAALACRSNSGYPQGGAGKLVIRFRTGNLNQLPGQIVNLIHSRGFQRASVASCGGASEASGFTTYRVAIVFY